MCAMTHGAKARCVPRHNIGERIRQTKHRMAGEIPDGRNRRAHCSRLDRVRFPQPGYGPVFLCCHSPGTGCILSGRGIFCRFAAKPVG